MDGLRPSRTSGKMGGKRLEPSLGSIRELAVRIDTRPGDANGEFRAASQCERMFRFLGHPPGAMICVTPQAGV